MSKNEYFNDGHTVLFGVGMIVAILLDWALLFYIIPFCENVLNIQFSGIGFQATLLIPLFFGIIVVLISIFKHRYTLDR